MIRRLLWLAVVACLAWVVRSSLRASRSGPAPEGPRRAAPCSGGRMVRDRVCNTFVPDGRALVVADEGTKHYFCSEKCRAEFLEGRAVPAS